MFYAPHPSGRTGSRASAVPRPVVKDSWYSAPTELPSRGDSPSHRPRGTVKDWPHRRCRPRLAPGPDSADWMLDGSSRPEPAPGYQRRFCKPAGGTSIHTSVHHAAVLRDAWNSSGNTGRVRHWQPASFAQSIGHSSLSILLASQLVAQLLVRTPDTWYQMASMPFSETISRATLAPSAVAFWLPLILNMMMSETFHHL